MHLKTFVSKMSTGIKKEADKARHEAAENGVIFRDLYLSQPTPAIPCGYK